MVPVLRLPIGCADLLHASIQDGGFASGELSLQAHFYIGRDVDRSNGHAGEGTYTGCFHGDQIIASRQIGGEAILELQGDVSNHDAILGDSSNDGQFLGQAKEGAIYKVKRPSQRTALNHLGTFIIRLLNRPATASSLFFLVLG